MIDHRGNSGSEEREENERLFRQKVKEEIHKCVLFRQVYRGADSPTGKNESSLLWSEADSSLGDVAKFVSEREAFFRISAAFSLFQESLKSHTQRLLIALIYNLREAFRA